MKLSIDQAISLWKPWPTLIAHSQIVVGVQPTGPQRCFQPALMRRTWPSSIGSSPKGGASAAASCGCDLPDSDRVGHA